MQLVKSVQSVPVGAAMAWASTVDTSGSDALYQALMGLMPTASSGGSLSTRVLFGGFSEAEGRVAMRKLGLLAGMKDVSGREYRERVVNEWRTALFGHARAVWSQRRQDAGS